MRLNHILFPVDFSERCATVAPRVCAMAGSFEAKLTLLHVVGAPAFPDVAYPGRVYESLANDLRERAADELSGFAARHLSGPAPETVIEEGDPAQSIVSYAHEHQADLIMMPTHGYGAFRRFLIGSVTARVLHDAWGPVWTSAHIDRAGPAAAGQYRNVLCAVDCGAAAVPVIRWAGWMAGHYGAGFQLVHVIPAMNETSANQGEEELRGYLTRRAGAEFEVLMENAGVRSPVLLRGGNIAAKLAETARQQHADLMVIGRGHTRMPLGRLRTHTLAIVRESPCPVLSV